VSGSLLFSNKDSSNCQRAWSANHCPSSPRPLVYGAAYNASKAALLQYSDTLRIELSPFDVRIVNLLTGPVKSELARVDRELPEGSLYADINAAYKNRLTLIQAMGVGTDEYTKDVVDRLVPEKSRSLWSRVLAALGFGEPKGTMWLGASVWQAWLASRVLPASYTVSVIFFRLSGPERMECNR
jgi:1-acylglycerone phosphate reductase